VPIEIEVPDSELCLAAGDLAWRLEHPAIAAHSVRTYLYARLAAGDLGLRAGGEFDVEELYVACVLHDIGTADAYNGAQRFEVDGADAAAEFLQSRGAAADIRQRVWEAIALHTSPGIAERLGPLTRLVRAGVRADFTPGAREPQRGDIEERYPRDDIERHLGDAVVRQAVANPAKAPAASWPGILLRAHLANPDHGGRNPAF
jgi:hypothetical protein